MKTSLLLLGFLSLALLLGCATPESRIKKNPDLFAALPPEVQTDVQQGLVKVGYPQDAAFLALGEPNHVYTRNSADKTVEVWSYTSFQTQTDRQRADVRVPRVDAQGRVISGHESVWVDVEQRTEYEYLRVEMENGMITAIERLNR